MALDTADQLHRWHQVVDQIAGLVPAGAVTVVVDSGDGQSAVVADRLADALHAIGRPAARLTDVSPYADEDTWLSDRTAQTVAVADGRRWREHRNWDVVIWLRTSQTAGREHGAHIVVDLHDPHWPVIRHVGGGLAGHDRWYITETRAFFAPRAATWDTKFGDDLPAYAAAIAEAGLPEHGVVADIGCGTGRALSALRRAVGPRGTVLAVDLTPEMLLEARRTGRSPYAALVVADARALPLADASVHVVFAAGLVMHLPDPVAGLAELARITRAGGLLVLFHPSGRAALAARHGRTLGPDEPLAEVPLRRAADTTGWRITRYDDAAHRFLAIAARR